MSLKSLRRSLYVVLALLISTPALAVPGEGTSIMISAPSDYAVDAGKAVSARGGNLIDVAVAVGLALTVTNPSNASLGGGGFAMVSMGEGVEVLDFREMAPALKQVEQAVSPGDRVDRNQYSVIAHKDNLLFTD